MTNMSTKRTPAQNDVRGMKLAIMAASLAITLGGWGVLAAQQGQNASAAPVVSQSSLSSSQTSTQTGTLRQVNPSTIQPQVIARTRSSR